MFLLAEPTQGLANHVIQVKNVVECVVMVAKYFICPADGPYRLGALTPLTK